MSKENAMEFIKKLYGDDEFAAEAIKTVGAERLLKHGGSTHEIEARQQEIQTEMGNNMGFDFTPEEYKEATKDWVKETGAFEAIKKGIHMSGVAKKVKKGKL